MNLSVIIAAAGSASRMGLQRNKALLPLLGQPVLSWSLELFSATAEVEEIIIAARKEELEQIRAIAAAYPKVKAIVSGGATRALSVRQALAQTSALSSHIAVHDAARPLLSPGDWRALMEAAQQGSAGVILAAPLRDSIRSRCKEMIAEALDRDQLLSAQTPQLFPAPLLRQAFTAADERLAAATDEAELVRAQGGEVRFVLAQQANFKLTVAEDLPAAAAVLRQRLEQQLFPAVSAPPDERLRYGLGWDIHRLEPGRRLVLGGIEIEHPLGLLGHSDADVLLHAVIDALLGAAALGDIGRRFPDTDPQYQDISSLLLLHNTVKLLQEQGWRIVNLDANIIAEQPRLAPHIEAIRSRIAQACGLPAEAVSVKAKTAERLGAVGSGQAIAAQAIAALRRA